MLRMSPRLISTTCLIAGVVCGESMAAEKGQGQQAETRRSYDLPRGDAATTLSQFAGISGTPIVFMMDKVRGQRTNAVKGDYSPREALDRMLAGTALSVWQDKSTGAFVISREAGGSPPAAADQADEPEPRTTKDRPKPMKRKNPVAALVGWLVVAVTTPTQAQNAAVAGQSTPASEAVVELSPFVVSGEEDTGYTASSTLAGTRLKASLENLSSSISVVTEKFMEDTGSTDARSLLVYTVGTEISGPGGNYSAVNLSGLEVNERSSRQDAAGSNRVRGLASADLTRDYFATNIPFDAYNTSRVEINRGSNAILFGLGSPAGIVNNATKGALFKNLHTVEAKVGSFGSVRGTVDINREILADKLAVRVIGLKDRQKFKQDPAFEDDSRYFLALNAKPFAGSAGFLSGFSIRGNYENGRIDANRPRITPPTDNLTPWFDPWHPNSSPKFTFDPGNQTFPSRVPYESEPMGAALRNPVVVYPDEQSATPRDPAATASQNIIGRQFVLSNWTFPSGVRNTAVQTAITRVNTALLAAGVQDSAFYSQPSLTDTSVFDFRNNLIDGPNKYEDSDFEAWNVGIEQLFLDNKAGIEVTVDRQEFTSRNGTLVGDGRLATLQVDIATTMIDGTPNANFGRPFLVDTPSMGYGNTERTAWRATAFYDLDFTKSENKWLRRLLGRHVFTGVASGQSREAESRSGATTYASNFTEGASTSIADGQGGRFAAVHYLGGSIADRSSLSGANIPRLAANRSLDPATLMDNGAVFFLKGQGATSVPGLKALDVFTNDRDLTIAPEGASLDREEVESLAFVAQSYFWDNQLVTTLGWRQDRLKTFDAGPAPLHPQGTRIVDPAVYKLPDTPNFSDKSDNFSWGLALHAPRRIVERISWIDRVSFYYNESSNFQPSGARFGVYGTRIGSPEGTTEDKGIGLSLFDNKLNIRATWYETSQNNISEGSVSSVIANIVSQGYVRVVNNTLIGLNVDTNGDGVPTEMGYVPPPQTLLDTFNVVRLPDGTATFSNPGNVVGTTTFQSKGFELEMVYNPTKQLTLVLNAAQQESVKDNSGADVLKFFFEDPVGPNGETLYDNWSGPVGESVALTEAGQRLAPFAEGTLADSLRSVRAQDGTVRQELREWRVNLVANYEFANGTRLEGWNVGGAFRWQSKQAVGYPYVDGAGGRISDLENPYFGPAEENLDAWVGYERSILEQRVKWRLQLNVRNLLNNDDLVPLRAQPTGAYAVYRIPEGIRWELTSRFTF